jgi:hypothetical protein
MCNDDHDDRPVWLIDDEPDPDDEQAVVIRK